VPTFAQATLTVTSFTWNIIGLDSNSPATGPRYFPVGARVCSNVVTTNVAVNWNWDSANPNVNLRAGSFSTINLPAIGAGACADAYFEVEVNQAPAAFDTMRRYHITATDGSGTASTPIPRELYVEHLISQNRNAITGVKLDGVSIPTGGSMNLVVGNTYTIELDGGTATQGYNQFEAFINFPNTIFEILSVSTTYSADNSPYVPGPAPIANDKLYADACRWENDPTSPNYRSCVGGDFKAGGSNVVTTYTIKVLSGAGTSQTLNTLLYDFSGSSFHYNADFGTKAVIANIVDPAAVTIAKAFSPSTTVPGGTSTLTFTIANPNGAAVDGANFSDPLPTLSGGQMVVATPATFSTSGCGSPTFAPVAGATSISFANGSIAPNSACVVTVRVSVPATPTSGTYTNTSNHLFVGTVDTGRTATATLGLTASSPGTGLCGQTLANWTVPTGTTANPPDLAGGIPTTKASNVGTASASANIPASTSIITTSGQNDSTSWQSFGYKNAGQYIQFVVDTHNYTGVHMSFYVANPGSGNGPTSITLSYDGGSGFNDVLTIANPVTAFTQHTFDFSGLASTTGSTTFRLRASGANNDNAAGGLNYDNIAFTGCATPVQPTLSKAFSPSAIAVNGTATLTFTLTNTNTAALTGARFSDTLPAGLLVAAAPLAATTCGGSPTWAPAPGATALTFGQPTGASIPASGSCTVSVNVKATTAGPHTNVSGFIATTEGGTNSGAGGSATSSLAAILPPSIQKTFATNPVVANGVSLLTFTITNPNESDSLTGVAFTDTYPGGLLNANPLTPAISNTCGGSVTATASGNSTSLSGGSLAGGASCVITVPVTASAPGVYANTSGAVSAATAGSGNTASASLMVTSANPGISLSKRVGTSSTGPWFKFVSVPPTTPLYYQFTVENIGDVALNPFNVTDPVLAGTGADPALCAWQSSNAPPTLPTLPVATATIDPTATCVVGPVNAALGDHLNTATAHGTASGVVHDSTAASADYIGALPGFSLLKQVGDSAVGPWSSTMNTTAGDDVFYKFTLVNTGALPLSAIGVTDPLVSTATCTFTDPLPINGATTCIVGPVTSVGAPGATTTNTATGQGTNSGSTFNTAPSSASYTINVLHSDLSIALDDGVTNVTPGGSTTYTMTVGNAGPDDVTDAIVIDVAPAGIAFVGWTCSVTNPGAGSVTTACGTASGVGDIDSTVTMKSGAVITYVITASVDAGASGSLTNTAVISPPSGTTDAAPGNNTASDTDTVTPIVPSVDLSVTNTDGVTSVVAGTTTTYAITVTNGGPDDVTNASIIDTAPAGVTFGSWTCVVSNPGVGGSVVTACGAASGTGDINTTATMKSGGVVTYTVVANVSPSASGSIVNTATVAPPPGSDDANLANNTATDSDTITPAIVMADLSITMTDGVTTVTPGGSTTYTILVTNNGPDDVTSASVVDIAPVGASFGSWTCSVVNPGAGGSVTTACGAANGTGDLNTTVTMEPGGVISYTIAASIAPGATGTLTDVVSVIPPAGITDPNPSNNAATDADTVGPAIVDLSVTNTDGVVSVSAGGSTTYTITLINAGPGEVSNAAFNDLAPAGVTFLNWTCVVTDAGVGGSVTTACGAPSGVGNINTTATMKSGAVLTFTVPATISPAAIGSIANTATIATPAGVADINPANNTAVDSDIVLAPAAPIADLSISNTDGVTSVTAGGNTVYTVTIVNGGPDEVTAAPVVDLTPAGMTFTTWSCAVSSPGSGGSVPTACGAASGTGDINTTVTMKNGAVITFTIQASVSPSASGSITNTALVTAPLGTADPTPGNNSGSDTDTVTPAALVADLAIANSDGVANVAPGAVTSYTVTVRNFGPDEVTNAPVLAAAPTGVAFGSWTCSVTNPGSGGSVTTACGASSGTGSLATTVTMKNGAVITYIIGATVDPSASGNLVSNASVAAPAGVTDPSLANNTATDIDDVVARAGRTPQAIPTLNQWMLAILVLLLTFVAFATHRRAYATRGPRPSDRS
jgi:uncharacterized repeat protein (TIGR01451 family)